MDTMGDRLKWARTKKGFGSARKAAMANGWTYSTYAAHENGQNEFGPEDAAVYGRIFGVSPGWLLTGAGDRHAGILSAEDEKKLRWMIQELCGLLDIPHGDEKADWIVEGLASPLLKVGNTRDFSHYIAKRTATRRKLG